MSTKSSAFFHLNRNNDQLDQMFTRLEPVDPAIFNTKPAPDKWSVVQVLNHLYDTEALSLKYLRFKEKEGDNFGKEKLITRLKLIGYFVLTALPLKFKAPGIISNPSNEDSFSEIVDKFAVLRKEFEVFMDGKDESFFQLASNKHAVIGRLKMKNMLRTYYTHTRHHEKQILRTIIAISK